jgi:adenine phosphoribosyltransferase
MPESHVTDHHCTPTTLNCLDVRIRERFRHIRDFPVPGFNFPDITPILETDPQLFRDIIDALLTRTAEWSYDTVLCVESFGYVFGVPIAYEKRCRIVPMRRYGKLPRRTIEQKYDMCYESGRRMAVHVEALAADSHVLVVDDFLASGGTIAAAIELIRRSAAKVAGVACVAEIPSLRGRDALAQYDVRITTLTSVEI